MVPKLYELLEEEGKHVYRVDGSEDEVWGTMGDDETNQARGAARFREIDMDDFYEEQEMLNDELYWKKNDYEQKLEELEREQQEDVDIDEAIDAIVALVELGIMLYGYYPVVNDYVKRKGHELKDWTLETTQKIKSRLSSLGKKKIRSTNIIKPQKSELEVCNQSDATSVDLSIEEAQELFLEMLQHYIELKKGYDILKNANIEGVKENISLEDIIVKMDALVEKYPILMSENASIRALSMLEGLSDDKLELEQNDKPSRTAVKVKVKVKRD